MGTRPGPRPPARCLALLGKLSRFIDDELPPRQRAAIQSHCRDCARCRYMIASLRRTVALYRTAGSAEMPPRARARAKADIARLLRDAGTRFAK